VIENLPETLKSKITSKIMKMGDLIFLSKTQKMAKPASADSIAASIKKHVYDVCLIEEV
jgi:hypothetical protein